METSMLNKLSWLVVIIGAFYFVFSWKYGLQDHLLGVSVMLLGGIIYLIDHIKRIKNKNIP